MPAILLMEFQYHHEAILYGRSVEEEALKMGVKPIPWIVSQDVCLTERCVYCGTGLERTYIGRMVVRPCCETCWHSARPDLAGAVRERDLLRAALDEAERLIIGSTGKTGEVNFRLINHFQAARYWMAMRALVAARGSGAIPERKDGT
jgi:hypothetical protein